MQHRYGSAPEPSVACAPSRRGKGEAIDRPADAQFVENVMWEESRVVFVTVNVPGSNNDTVPWSSPYDTQAYKAAQAAEVADRTAADIRWLERAFAPPFSP
jgi:hypothetical protein